MIPDLASLPDPRPVFDPAAIELQRRMRFNPLRMLSPEGLSQALDQFDAGLLSGAALLWDAMCRRDDTLSFLKPQLEETIAARPWGVHVRPNAPAREAARHKAALEWFYDHLQATDAFDRNRRGGRHLLLRQMMTSASFGYAVHHFVWQPQPGTLVPVAGAAPVPALTAELELVPLWYFENTTGRLRFLPQGGFGLQGLPLDWDREWMVTCGEGLMFAASICYTFKRLTFQDWTIYNERYGQGKVVAQTPAREDSAQGQAMAAIVANFNGDQGIVFYEAQPGERPPISVLGPEGTASAEIFQSFLERQDRKLTVLYRGSDLANMSRDGETTGVSAQREETEKLERAHGQRIADACHEGIDRKVIRYCFGEGVEPLAYFGLPGTEAEDAQEVRASAGFLADRGARVDLAEAAHRLGIGLTEDPAAALRGRTNTAE